MTRFKSGCRSLIKTFDTMKLVAQLLRLVIGPVETKTWLAFSPLEKSVGLAVTMVLAAALLAAAIDWLLGPKLRVEPADGPEPVAPTAVSAEAGA